MADHIDKLLTSIRCRENHFIPERSSPEFIDEFEEMELRDDDIFVVTYPKGGTHWMLEIVQLILFDGQADKVDAENRRGVIENSNVKIPLPHIKAEAGPNLRQLKYAPSPRVLATHSPCLLLPRQLGEKCCKVVYVYRHPKDTVVSFYNFKRKLAEIESNEPVPHSPLLFSKFFDAVISGNYDYGRWFDHVTHYYQYKDNDNYFFVSYEAMKENLGKVVKDLALFLGHPLDEEAICRVVTGASLETMRSSYNKQRCEDIKKDAGVVDMNVYLNKGEVKQWTDFLTKEQSDVIDKILMEKMQDCELMKAYAPMKIQETVDVLSNR